MTQTMKGKNSPTKGKQEMEQKRTRPGQRQQERLQRRERRRKRLRLWLSGIFAVALVALSIYLFILYQNNQTRLAALAVQHDNATATAQSKVDATSTAKANVTATAQALVEATAVANSQATVVAGTPTPKAGAPTPPAVTGATVTTSDGLKYIDVAAGSGKAAKAGDTVYALYTGWLQSTNKEFDSSYDHGGAAIEVTPLGQAQIIAGWNEGLVGMKVGGTRRLIIPPNLGYGATVQGPIPANSTLIFDVTLVYIK